MNQINKWTIGIGAVAILGGGVAGYNMTQKGYSWECETCHFQSQKHWTKSGATKYAYAHQQIHENHQTILK